MTLHNPERVHWAKLLAKIRGEGGSMPIYMLERALGENVNREEFNRALEQLVRQKKVRVCIGSNVNGVICNMVYVCDTGGSPR